MATIQIFYLYLLTVPVFFLIDLIWLGVVAQRFYQSQLGHLLGEVNWVAAVIFYLIFIFGIIFFAVLPALNGGTLLRAALVGALFGFVAYATYDLTNLATLKDWPLTVSLVDMVWGAVLSGSVASISFIIGSRFFS